MAKVLSCGVILIDTEEHLFVCHATGTSRWDLPKGLAEVGELPAVAAVRETHEETGLQLDRALLHDLGEFAYLPRKRLHLFAQRVAPTAFDIGACRCRSTFPHPATGRPTPEVDEYAWKPVAHLDRWCGKNLANVLRGVDWTFLAELPVVRSLRVDTRSGGKPL